MPTLTFERYKAVNGKLPLIECSNDHETKRHGFMWLKKKSVKIDGLTRGKQYDLMAMENYDYGNKYSVCEFQYVLIKNDSGTPQLYPIELFK